LCERRPTGFFILATGFVAIDIIVVTCSNGSGEGVLSQAGLNKTIERDPRQRGSQSKRNFRMHARDEKELFRAMQAFYYIFAMFSLLFATRLVYVFNGFSHWALDVERWALNINC